MFGFFASQQRKARDNAANWIELADKVWHFRRDLLSEKESADLIGRITELRQLLKAKADAARLKISIEALEGVLRRTGGAIYPKTSLVENVEFFLVAAIVILGIRTYFVQPFKIPTNSMWPTYHGMTAENFTDREAPGALARVGRFLAFGAQRREAIAPTSGPVTAEFNTSTGAMDYAVVNGRSWLVLPAKLKEYTFYVGDQRTTVRVPLDFNEFDQVVTQTFFGGDEEFLKEYRRAWQERRQRGGFGGSASTLRLTLRERVSAGEPIVRFDILTGDQLFVDRMSYHFMRPKVGQGFVFRTGEIEGIGDDQYYIKRLVGVPGDRLEIKEPVLYRNGAPITGAKAFESNADQMSPYRGYFNAQPRMTRRSAGEYLLRDQVVEIPPDSFFALGDNSRNSEDSRYWGYVPAKEVVGRPLWIYYPFTRRWGPAR